MLFYDIVFKHYWMCRESKKNPVGADKGIIIWILKLYEKCKRREYKRIDELTEIVTPYDKKELVQHWVRWWLLAWQHQVIAWTNVDLSSVRSIDNCQCNFIQSSQELIKSVATLLMSDSICFGAGDAMLSWI